MIGDHIERFGDQAGLPHFHAGGRRNKGLARAHGMGEQRIAAAHDTPDGIFLIWSQRDVRAHAGKGEVGAIETAQPDVVIEIIIEAYQALGTIRIG